MASSSLNSPGTARVISFMESFSRKWPVIILLILVMAVVRSSIVTVRYGTVGVITRFGRVTGTVLQPGLGVKIPFVDQVVRYRTQKIIYETLEDGSKSYADYQDFPVDTTTSDGQQVSLRYTLRFSIDPEKVKYIANNIGTEREVVERVVKTDSRIYTREVPRKYKAIDLYSGNVGEVREEITKILRPKFEDNGLILDEFGIRSITFQPDYVSAVEEKQIESERVVAEEYRAKQEEFRKQALITKAQGEAESQRLQQMTLSELIIQKMWIEKWNGTLPTYVGNGESLILDMGRP